MPTITLARVWLAAKLAVYPPRVSTFESQQYAAIIGAIPVCTAPPEGNYLRLAVPVSASVCATRARTRSSKAVRDHCCEYMTGGHVTVLGRTGVNFGAGMTGGFAYVLDQENRFVDRYNSELVEICRINSESFEMYRNHLRAIIAEFVRETGSAWGHTILDNFADYVGKFWMVKPKAANLESLLKLTKSSPQ